MTERRRAPRYDCSFKVDYASRGIASIESQAKAEDISKFGIRLPLSKILNAGAVLNMHIYTEQDSNPVFATGRVKWTRADISHSPHTVEAGIEFTEIESGDIEKLLSFCS